MVNKVESVPLEAPRRILVWLFLAVGAWYLAWRPGTLNPDAPVFSWLVYGAEVFGFATALLHIFMCWRLSVRKAPPARPGRSVDVFIPTYNESVELVRKTLLAAIAMDYPHRTWLLDDGRRPEMQALAEELGCDYLARPDNRDAKAGNLNHALAHSNGEFVAVFDADHAPRRDFLLKTLGYFDDTGVAFVQTPQEFFNLDSFQHRRRSGGGPLWTEQSLFFRVIQRGKDYWNAAFFCGSCAVVRRASLDRIGGFATGTVTEDLHTSIRLHAAGFSSVFHAEALAFGIAPESVAPFISQRIRWGQGAMHVWRKEGILTCRGLSWAQRLNYFASVLTYFDGWQKAVFYAAPVFVLITGNMPLVSGGWEFLLHFAPYYLLSFWVFEEVGRGYGRTLFIEQYNMARFAAFAWATLALLFPFMKFKVTPKGAGAGRATRFTLAQWTVLGINLVAIPVGIALYLRGGALPVEGLVVNVMWASVNIALAIAVLTFTALVQARKRRQYRFPVPLAAQVEFQGERLRGTMDDVSESGMRFYGRLPAGLQPGSRVSGQLTLPDGPLEFSGEVRMMLPTPGEEGFRGFGFAFTLRKAEQYRLERFLYGSDLQWVLNGYSDQVGTPLSRLLPRRVHGPRARAFALLHWNAAEVTGHSPGAAAQVLVSTSGSDGAQRWVLSYSELPENQDLHLEIFRRTASGNGTVRLQRATIIDVDLPDSVYFYRMRTTDAALVPEFAGAQVAA